MTDGRAKLVVASNRGPFAMEEGEDGSLRTMRGGGGLAPSLATALAGRSDTVWVAAALSDADRKAASRSASETIESGQEGLALRFVDLEASVMTSAYNVIANSTLWFLFHGLFDLSRRPLFDRRFYRAWDDYRRYNQAFAESAAAVAAPGAVVLVNDYHLLLAGKTLAERRPDLLTVHFSHTPFSAPDELEILPPRLRSEILTSLASFGACGFHTEKWERNFRACCERENITPPATFRAGLGADLAGLQELGGAPAVADKLGRLDDLVGDRMLIVRSDRLELSKNLVRGLFAYDLMLAEHPELRERVILLARAYPSREGLPEYLAYRSEMEHLARVVNERWATAEWTPVVLDVDDDFPATLAALKRYDVLLVNPVRDGMNLVAKEGPLLNELQGVLVLSRFAGAYEDLGGAVMDIHPFDVSDTAEALARALEMPPEERAARATVLRERAVSLSPSAWLEAVLSEARLTV